MKHRLRELISDLEDRVADAVISRSRIVNTPLRQFLRERISRPAGTAGGFLADPVFEAAFGWEQASETMQELSASGFLNPALLASLAKSIPIDEENRKSRNTFPSDRRPFTHQLKAWQTLGGKEIKSVVVSSGTGSGKTEAFLVPILDSLARQQEIGGRLVGVQALMLYPLNALIASQQDRFADWTEPFGGNIRFCLYNGNTPERVRESEQREIPWEVRDRKNLRASPPPILVTNATMLEYMLIRSADAPILAASRGQLRWVVLDEAHTYVGSQAAEMTLLLRRTLHAFGVKPSEVRFIATSATLGAGEETRLQLKRFLADLAGTDEDQVESIEGHRLVPEVSPHDDDYNGIALVPSAISARERLAKRPATLSELSDKAPPGQTLELLESCANSTNRRGDAFLPLRLHLFLRSHAGVWACLNPKCAGREGTPLQAPEWPYGKAFERDTPQCDVCGSLTCEVLLCDDCGSSFLDVATDGGWQNIERWREERAFDEFLADADEGEEGDEEEPDAISTRHILGPPSIPGGTQISVDSTSGSIRDRATESTVAWALFERSSCPCCGAGGATRRLFRSLRLGGPFMVGTAANVLLDRTPERIPATADMPFGGRQLITFTDNRQGTARFAAKWQQDSERNYFRSIIYHALHAAGSSGGDEIREKEGDLRLFEPLAPSNPAIAAKVERIRAQLKTLETVGAPLTWRDLKSQLAAANRDQRELLDLWKDRDPRFGAADELATLQLFTEFLRRPVRTNSLESMGVAAIQFAAIERLTEAALPALFLERSATIQDWKDYLYLLLTFFIRANSVVHIDDGLRWWVGQRIAPKSAYAPDYDGAFASAHIGWPRLVGGGGRASRPILLLRDGLKLDLHDRGVREQVNETLRQAYASISPLRVGAAADYKLDLTKAVFTKVTNAWLCPVTGRILDRTFRGLTPYLSQIPNSRPVACKAVAMPRLPVPWLKHEDGTDAREETITWLKLDGAVTTLRKDGIWTDLHDRLVLRNPFIRVVEHSAQQPSNRLRAFERDFKLGRINVLSCSTTMEMGVDIGGISTVLMTNVPPSPASYRQRVGRAGRRNEALSVAFAYCSDSPLGWTTFDDPKSPLEAQIRPPRVALESQPIVQRHVNAFLLGFFLRTQVALGDVSRIGLETEWFFSPDLAMEAPCAKFVSWIRNPGDQRRELDSGVTTIVARTVLQQHPNLYEECIETLEPIVEAWTAEYRTLRGDLEASVDQAAKIALGLQLKRLVGEFLLTHLAQAGFLPGHGFPTDVVPFVVHSPAELRATGRGSGRRDDGAGRSRGYPSRQLDQAIREYAPGADIVLDGLVYQSAGVTLNWKRPAGASEASEIQSLMWFWRCGQCHAIGTSHGLPELCSSCGSDRLTIDRVLRPGGFTVDSDSNPNNDIEHVTYIPPSRPALGMRGVQWSPLENPELGRCRSTPEGHILALSRGTTGGGYAVCLMCGRAAPETSRSEDGSVPSLPKAMQDHRSLRRPTARRSPRCEAIDRPFAIQRHLALGYSRRTDVFELQLAGLRDEMVSTTLAIALREALARQLGIERDEIGWSAEEAPCLAGDKVFSIYLYDTAAGGAGYASTAGSDVIELLQATRRMLECSNPGCLKGCPACLIVRDSAAVSGKIDRVAAIEFLTPILDRMVLSPSDQVFGAGVQQRASTIPLPQVLEQSMAGPAGRELWLFLPEDVRNWNFGAWWASPLVERVGRQGRTIRIVVPQGREDQFSFDLALSMQSLANRAGPSVAFWSARERISPPGLVAAIATGSSGTAWATRSESAPSDEMGSSPPEILIRGDSVQFPRVGNVVDVSEYLRRLTANTFRLEIGTELDGPAAGFGGLLWRKIAEINPTCRAVFHAGRFVSHVTYTDRYLFSPLSARLLYEVARSMPGRSLDKPAVPLVISTQGDRREGRYGFPDQLNHDWPNSAVRKSVLESILTRAGFRTALGFNELRDLPHGRAMKIEYVDGGSVEVLFDQGFGYWRFRGRSPFDFNANVSKQAESLIRATPMIIGDRQHKTTIVVDLSRGLQSLAKSV